MRDDTRISDALIHAGAGTAQLFAFLGLIPGFIPIVALTVLVGAVLVAPVVAAGLAVVLIGAPFYLASRVLGRARRRRRRQAPQEPIRRVSLPSPHAASAS
jgi:hypothetical protein